MQLRLKAYLTGMQGRMKLLKSLWEREQHEMIMQLAKVKNKNKKQKEFLARVRAIPDTVKDAILTMYMGKCKHQNAVTFFEWRRKLHTREGDSSKQKAHQLAASMAVSMRLTVLRKQESTLFDNTDD